MFGLSLRDSLIVVVACLCCIGPVATLLLLVRFKAVGLLLPVIGVFGGLIRNFWEMLFNRDGGDDDVGEMFARRTTQRPSIDELRQQAQSDFDAQLAGGGFQAQTGDPFQPNRAQFQPQDVSFKPQPPANANFSGPQPPPRQPQNPPGSYAPDQPYYGGPDQNPQLSHPPQNDRSDYAARYAPDEPNRVLRDRRYARNEGPQQFPASTYNQPPMPDTRYSNQPPPQPPNNASEYMQRQRGTPQQPPPQNPGSYAPGNPYYPGQQQPQQPGQPSPPAQNPGAYPVRPGGDYGYRIEPGAPGPQYSPERGGVPPQGNYPPQPPQENPQQGGSVPPQPPQGNPQQQGGRFPHPGIDFNTAPGQPPPGGAPGYSDDDYYGDAGIPGLRRSGLPPNRDRRNRSEWHEGEIFGGMLDDEGDGYPDF